jgi:hypothetical protein
MILKDDLRRLILKQQNDLRQDHGVRREISLKFLPKFALIVSGIRRCGKSTLARQFLRGKKPVYYCYFEDINLVEFDVKDFRKLDQVFHEEFGEGGAYFFDEIQNIDGWERYVRQLVDDGKQVLITGSNASMLSKELGTRLTGRQISSELFPFSYKEFLRLKKWKHSLAHFEDFLKMGGFPEYLKNGNTAILRNLFNDIFYRDVLQRNDVRNETALKTLLQYVLSNIGKETSFNKLKALIKVGSGNTVSQFMYHFEQAYLLFAIKRFDYSYKKQMVHPKKVYCIDNAIVGVNAFSFSENRGCMLENLVFLELKRRGEEIYYHKAKGECDFVCMKSLKIDKAIQVCYTLNDDNTDREINGLMDAMQEYNLKEGLLLTMQQSDRFDLDGKRINVLPVWEWLLKGTRSKH